MKKIRTGLITLIFALAIAGAFLFKVSFWETKVEQFLNENISQDGWTAAIGSLNGHLLSTVSAENIQFFHQDSTQVMVAYSEANINIWRSIIFGGINMDRIIVRGLQVIPGNITLEPSSDEIQVRPPKLPRIKFDLKNFELDGSVPLTIKDELRLYSIAFKGDYSQKDGKASLRIEDFSGGSSKNSNAFSVTNVFAELDSSRFHMFTNNGSVMGVDFSGTVNALFSEKQSLTIDLAFAEYTFPDYIFERLPLQPKFSSLESTIHLSSDFHRFTGDVYVKNPLGLNMEGTISLRNEPNHIAVDQIDLKSETARLTLQGIIEYAGRFNGTVSLTHLNLKEWITGQQDTDITGFVLFEGLIDSTGQVSDIDLTAEVQETEIYADKDVVVSGSVQLHDDLIKVSHPLTLSIGPSSVIVQGEADLASEYVDFNLKLKDADVFLINNFWDDSLTSGTATGSLELQGPLDIPTVKGDLICQNIGFRNTHLEYAEMTCQINRIWDFSSGWLQMDIGKGTWNEYGFDNGAVDVQFQSEAWKLSRLEFKDGEDFLQLSGSVSIGEIAKLDRIQFAYRGHYLASTKPLVIHFIEDDIKLDPFEIHIDDGIMKGEFYRGDSLDGKLNLSNIDADIVQSILGMQDFPITGIAFGKAVFSMDSLRTQFMLNGSIKNGTFFDHPYDNLDLSVEYKDRTFSIERFQMEENGRTSLNVNGEFPLPEHRDEPLDIKLIAQLDQIAMPLVSKLLLNGMPIKGLATGVWEFGGNTESTQFHFDLDITDCYYDLIPLGQVQGKAEYTGRRLVFDNYTSNYRENLLSGSGYLPMDLNIGSESFGTFIRSDSMHISTEGSVGALNFLSPYISSIDSITGSFDIGLIIRGFPDAIMRDGYLSGTDAAMYPVMLQKPIVVANASAILTENVFEIRYFDAVMVKEGSQSPNLALSGNLNLDSFFKPKYDIELTGSDVYFKTLFGDIEGIVDLDLEVSGRDTILISGDIAPKEGVIRKEFTSSAVASVASEPGRVITHYQIHFPIQQEFLLQNSQVDAIVTGDISISKFGESDSDFSGELMVSDGKFYYYHDVFKELRGPLVFDGKGFHPTMDISASTTIGKEEISITLVGPLENPDLYLESASGFSQSDILELLTFHRRFEDQEISSEGFGAQAQTILGAYLESQLEKNLFKISGIEDMGLVDDVSVTGMGSLINPESDEEFTIKAERKISDNLSLNYSYKRSFSLVNPNQSKMGVELKLNPYFSLVGSVDEEGFMSVKYRLRYSY
ncbi:MAG: translocation/assembly module TamB domain-containing protein [Candidatus Marinimicrobia bacterium]|nr:translocation/assembly module TamB domain-containing protein [Candidatus Neomarinimicrobiota bacterium]